MQLFYVFLRHFRRNKLNNVNPGSLSDIQTQPSLKSVAQIKFATALTILFQRTLLTVYKNKLTRTLND